MPPNWSNVCYSVFFTAAHTKKRYRISEFCINYFLLARSFLVWTMLFFNLKSFFFRIAPELIFILGKMMSIIQIKWKKKREFIKYKENLRSTSFTWFRERETKKPNATMVKTTAAKKNSNGQYIFSIFLYSYLYDVDVCLCSSYYNLTTEERHEYAC